MKKSTIFLFCLIPSFLFSQIIFEKFPILDSSEIIYFKALDSPTISKGDLDNDGDLDFFITGWPGKFPYYATLYWNQGNGIFKADKQLFNGVYKGVAEMADFDGDADLDIFYMGTYGSDQFTFYYENLGTGSFQEVGIDSIPAYKNPASVVLDFDGDLDLDIMISGFTAKQNRPITSVYLNNGSGVFSALQNNPFDSIRARKILVSDIGINGDLDIVLNGTDTAANYVNALYKKKPNGNYTKDTLSNVDTLKAGKMVFLDYDNDLDDELLLVGTDKNDNELVKLYENDKSSFTDVFAEFTPVKGRSLLVDDFNNDGYQDAVIAGFYSDSITSDSNVIDLYFNDTLGGFNKNLKTVFPEVRNPVFSSHDLDGNGFQDIIIMGKNTEKQRFRDVYLNYGDGNFQSSAQKAESPIRGVRQNDFDFADLDEDGDLDLIVMGNYDNGSVLGAPNTSLYWNAGDGFYVKDSINSFFNLANGTVDFIDLNDDGKKDVFLRGDYSRGARSKTLLYLNKSDGLFALDTNNTFEQLGNGATDFSDIDGDGDIDILYTGSNFNNRPSDDMITAFYWGDGTGNFTRRTGLTFPSIKTHDKLILFDADGDDDDDLLICEATRTLPINRFLNLYENDGKGNFSLFAGNSFNPAGYVEIHVSDVDGDDDLDILVVGDNQQKDGVAIYLNNGSGSYTKSTGIKSIAITSGSAAFSDFDGDKDQDLIIAGFINGKSEKIVYTNDGSGVFTEEYRENSYSDGKVAFADVDGDGDEDYILAGRKSPSPEITTFVYKNFTCQDSLILGMDSTLNSISTNLLNVEYQWVDCNNSFAEISNETLSEFQVLTNGSFALVITSNDFCKDTSKCYTYSMITNLNEQKEESEFFLFPNPVAHSVLITVTNLNDTYREVFIYNNQGVLVKQVQLNDQSTLINVSELSAGLYFVRMNESIHKLIITKE